MSHSALVKKRFNWMGTDKTLSHVEVVSLLREPPKGSMQRTKEERARVAREIRCYLDQIKRELAGHHDDDDDDDEGSEARSRAATALTAIIRGSRARQGHCLVSYVDGTGHDGPAALKLHNDEARKNLIRAIEEVENLGDDADDLDRDDAKILREILPPAEDFDEIPTEAGAQSDYSDRARAKAREMLKYKVARVCQGIHE